MLPAIGAIVFWIGVVVAAYVILRCVEMFSASGAQERHRVTQVFAMLVIVTVVIALITAYGHYDAMMKAAESGSSRY